MEAWTFGLQVRDTYSKSVVEKMGSYFAYNLIFFLVIILFSCRESSETDVQIQWNGEKAEGFMIPKSLVSDIPKDSITSFISVQLSKNEKPNPILGNFYPEEDFILFKPLIPFTPGLLYKVLFRKNTIGLVEIPLPNIANAPSVTGIFPSDDTLPENMLKVYILFSKPMREGKSAENVTLIKNGNDTIQGAFLDLQPELWNSDRTVLTLWLDPGRIKRDLQPNKLLGAPLLKDSNYEISVSQNWQDEQGATLKQRYSKKFITAARDSISPHPENWDVKPPAANSIRPLVIQFGEALDYSLLQEILSVRDTQGNKITGKWEIIHYEHSCRFRPDHPWRSGNYFLMIETRLEDLAGNNINRLFDRDVSDKTVRNKNVSSEEISFAIH